MKIENRLKEIGIKLPDAPAPAANYVPSVVVGDIVYILAKSLLTQMV